MAQRIYAGGGAGGPSVAFRYPFGETGEAWLDRAVAYAYLSAAADFHISQMVDRTVGVHGVIAKAHFHG